MNTIHVSCQSTPNIYRSVLLTVCLCIRG